MRSGAGRSLVRALGATIALLLSASCVDVCVLSGRPCDTAADCEATQICRLRRGFELGCVFAAGTCEVGDCGAVGDCAADQCCDPEQNRCVDQESYTGSCDARTCSECPEPQDCPLGLCGLFPECVQDSDCAADQRCKYSKCRKMCTDDSDCPRAECAAVTCSEEVGTPCSSRDMYSSECAGADCTDLSSSGTRRDPYCTRNCYSSDDPCPSGFECVENECRQP